MRLTAVRRLAQKWGSGGDDDIPTEIPKPYTTPPGFKPPTLGEQWRYAVMKHPYYRYGYSLAILVGVIGYGIATEQRSHEHGSDSSSDDSGGSKAAATSSSGVDKSST